MTVCLKCGAENLSTDKYCVRCEMPLPDSGVGGTLTGGPTHPEAGAALPPQKTLFGMAPGHGATDAPARAGSSQHTLFGITAGAASPATPPREAGAVSPRQAEPAHQPELAAQRTLLGVMPDDLAKAIAAARAPMGAVPSTGTPNPGKISAADAASDAGFQLVRNASTMLGTAPLGAIPVKPAAAAPGERASANAWSPAPSPLGDATSAVSPVQRRSLSETRVEPAATAPSHGDSPGIGATPPLHAKTHLGVAIPGVAPLRPGVSSTPPAQVPLGPALDATQLHPDAAPPSFGVPARVRMPRSALVLLGSGLVLFIAAAAFAVLWSGSKPLSARVSSDAAGKDRIDLVCEDCVDGTLVSLGDVIAEVRGRTGYLTLEQPLPLGKSALIFALRRPGAAKAEEVQVSLPPVEYRIRPDTSTLAGDQPRLTLNVDALPGSQIEIAETAVTLDSTGRGEIGVDVGAHLIGPATEVATFEQTVRYKIVPPSGKEYQGELRVKIGVTPLMLEAPGADTVTDMERFMLAGRTTKGAQLWVAGNPIPVDDEGRFAQLMSIDALGETQVTVRASQPGLAPRFASFRLQRVKDLQLEAQGLRKRAVPLAKAMRDIPAHVGQTVFVSGKIEDVRVDGHRALIILQADRDCQGRFCLARLVYGGLRKLERGLNVTAIGRLQGATAGVDSVPEIEVSLLL